MRRDGLGGPGMRGVPHRALGVHVLAPATPAELARGAGWTPEAEKPARQPRDVPGDRLLVRGEFLRRLAVAPIGYRAPLSACSWPTSSPMFGAYNIPRDHEALLWWFPLIGYCQGAFALFTMPLPPSSQRCSAPRARDSATTSAESPRPLASSTLVSIPRRATTASRSCTPAFSSCPRRASPCSCRGRGTGLFGAAAVSAGTPRTVGGACGKSPCRR